MKRPRNFSSRQFSLKRRGARAEQGLRRAFFMPVRAFCKRFSAISVNFRKTMGEFREISRHCRNAKAFHTEFRRVVKMQLASIRNFSALQKYKGLPRGISPCCKNATTFHTEFQRIVKMQLPSTRNFDEFSKRNCIPYGISGRFQNAKGIHTRFYRVVKNQRAFLIH